MGGGPALPCGRNHASCYLLQLNAILRPQITVYTGFGSPAPLMRHGVALQSSNEKNNGSCPSWCSLLTNFGSAVACCMLLLAFVGTQFSWTLNSQTAHTQSCWAKFITTTL